VEKAQWRSAAAAQVFGTSIPALSQCHPTGNNQPERWEKGEEKRRQQQKVGEDKEKEGLLKDFGGEEGEGEGGKEEDQLAFPLKSTVSVPAKRLSQKSPMYAQKSPQMHTFATAQEHDTRKDNNNCKEEEDWPQAKSQQGFESFSKDSVYPHKDAVKEDTEEQEERETEEDAEEVESEHSQDEKHDDEDFKCASSSESNHDDSSMHNTSAEDNESQVSIESDGTSRDQDSDQDFDPPSLKRLEGKGKRRATAEDGNNDRTEKRHARKRRAQSGKNLDFKCYNCIPHRSFGTPHVRHVYASVCVGVCVYVCVYLYVCAFLCSHTCVTA